MIPFPLKVLEQHAAVLGKTGAGKSSAMRVVVEHLLDHNKRVCVIDPKGDWWGLKTGYPVITFGDFKGDFSADVPINEQSGKHVAELITSGNRPCVIGFRGWFTSHMTNFWVEFAKTLFHSNEGELYLIIDEAQNFAPKGSLKGIEGKAGTGLHWTNRLLAEGRGLGINIWVGSQRPQKVHNDTLDGCETLIAMRTVHPAARGALATWMKGAGDKEAEAKILSSIGEMPRGEAWVWSPEIGFGPKHVVFPMFKTFDSFAPPQLQKKVTQQTWADVDLDEVKEKLASVIREVEAKDPAKLRVKIAQLESELRKRPVETKVEKEVERVEVPVLKDSQITQIEKAAERMYGEAERHGKAMSLLWENFNEVAGTLSSAMQVLRQPTPHSPFPKNLPDRSPLLTGQPTPRRKEVGQTQSNNGNIDLGRCERAILSALAQYPQGRSSVQIAILAGYSSNSGGFNNSLSKLRSAGYITRGQPSQITGEGKVALGDWEPLPTGQELLRYWCGKLGKCERSILDTLAANYPNSLTTEQIAETSGYSANSGGFNNSLSRLRTLELINRGQPIKLSDDLLTPLTTK